MTQSQHESEHFSLESHSFNVGIATLTQSLEAATIFNHIIFWIKINKQNGKNQIDGRTWMYQSIPDMAYFFPYMNERQIKFAITKLVEKGLLIKGNFNENKFDKTAWYALADENLFISQKKFTKVQNCTIEDSQENSKKLYDGTKLSHRENKIVPSTPYIYKDTIKDTNVGPSCENRSLDHSISFDFENGKFLGITEKDLELWKSSFPDVDIDREISRISTWALATPEKAKKKKMWRKVFLRWFRSEQEKEENKKAYQSMRAQVVPQQSESAKNEISKRRESVKKFIESIDFTDYFYKMEAFDDYVEFKCGERVSLIPYVSENFKEEINQAYNQLKNLGKAVLKSDRAAKSD